MSGNRVFVPASVASTMTTTSLQTKDPSFAPQALMAMKHESRKRPAPASNVGGSGDSDSSSKSKRDKTADSLRLFDESLLKDVVQRKIDHMSLVVNFTGPGTFIEDLLRHKQDAALVQMQKMLVEKSEKLEATAMEALHELESKDTEWKQLTAEREQQKKQLADARAEAAALREERQNVTQIQSQLDAVRNEGQRQMDALREENKTLHDQVKITTELGEQGKLQLGRLQDENGRLKSAMRKLRDEVGRVVGQMSQELDAM